MSVRTSLLAYEAQRAEEVAQEYLERGYEVLREPQPDQLPAGLARFSPDLLVRKGDEVIVVEVKSRATLGQEPLVRDLHDAIKAMPGWRLELIVANPDEQRLLPLDAEDWTAEEVAARVEEGHLLLRSEHVEAALLVAWSAAEATLRRLATAEGLTTKRQDAGHLLKRLVLAAVISKAEYDVLRNVMAMRNAVAHGQKTNELTATAVERLLTMVDGCIEAKPGRGVRLSNRSKVRRDAALEH